MLGAKGGGVVVDVDVAQLAVDVAGLDVVAQLDVEEVEDLAADVGREDGHGGFNPSIEVAPHPVGGGEVHRLFAIAAEVPEAGVLEIHVHDTRDADVGTVATVGRQATNAAHEQVDLHARLTGLVEFVDHLLILEAVHLENDSPSTTGTRQVGLTSDQADQLRHHVETRHQ